MKMKFEREHNLSFSVVKSRIDQQISIAEEKFGHLAKSYEWQWDESTLTGKVEAYGTTSNARTEVTDQMIHVEFDVPLILRPLKGKITQMANFRLDKICR